MMMNSTTKEMGTSVPRDRVTARVSHDVYMTINEAATLSGTTINNYIVQAALQQAQDLIDTTRMKAIKLVSEADVAWFLSKIEEPFKPNTKLANALRKYEARLNDNTENSSQTV
jgi:uncharacterized protein (DUF1778 family)